MLDRYIPEKIRDFLIERPMRRYCDRCIQERLGLKWRQQVQLVTATLAVTELFIRERGECCTCHETKQVIATVGRVRAEDVPSIAQPATTAQPGGLGSRVKLRLAKRSPQFKV
jgi:hypothetical protein